ncbi:MAG: hypothetical protein L0216_05280 [Planctomycetales bacterium]|nr:hypothetical protein [Planctomycetales bacterium]
MADDTTPDPGHPVRLVEGLAVAALAAAAGATAATTHPSALYCCHCRTCNTTLEHCPAGITAQDELAGAVASGDKSRFVLYGGLACLRCGACNLRCDLRLPLARMFGKMQEEVRAALPTEGPAAGPLGAALASALGDGLVGREYVDAVAAVVRKSAPEDA